MRQEGRDHKQNEIKAEYWVYRKERISELKKTEAAGFTRYIPR